MAKAYTQKVVYYGLNEHGRVSWFDPINKACVAYANAGISIQTIASWTHLTVAQVIYRLRKKGVSVCNYRNGEGPRAEAVRARHQHQLEGAWKVG